MPRSRKKQKSIPCPKTTPLIELLGMVPGQHVLRFRDCKTPDMRSKPFGATEMQLFVAVTDTYGAPVEEARYRGKYTRYPAVVEFDSSEDGRIATHYGRWVNRKGEEGPWSEPLSLRIAA